MTTVWRSTTGRLLPYHCHVSSSLLASSSVLSAARQCLCRSHTVTRLRPLRTLDDNRISSLSHTPTNAFHLRQLNQVMDPFCSVLCGIAASVGLLSHIFYFVRGEHHQHTLQFLQILLYGFFPSSFILARLLQIPSVQAMQLGAVVVGSYLTALWMSMLIYRSFFHRLDSFPGPRLAKLSKFYQVFTGLRLDAFRRSHAAHQKYGNFVRTGELILVLRLQLIGCFSSDIWNFPVFSFIWNSKQLSSMQHHFAVVLSALRPSKVVKRGPLYPRYWCAWGLDFQSLSFGRL